MARIELVFFAGCPHVDTARRNLRRALEESGRSPGWVEWDLDAGPVPDHARGRPSPTVLVDGLDAQDGDDGATGRSCRAAGAPSVATLVRALTR